MKRRTFLQALGAGGALGLHAPWSLARLESMAIVPPRPLVAVYDRLPEPRARVETPKTPPGGADDRFALFPPSEDDFFLCPLLIGLGPAGETLVNQTHKQGIAPEDAGLYRTAGGKPALPGDGLTPLERRLGRCAAALLLIDGQDPQALSEGLAWAQRLAREEVYLRAALLLNAPRTPLLQPWKSAMRALLDNVLELRTRGASLPPAASVRALLYGLPFMTPGLICTDLVDVRAVLRAGPQARTTAVVWNAEAMLPVAVSNACLPLRPPQDGGGALAWLHGGPDLSIQEFDQVITQLQRHLPSDASVLVADVVHARWTERRRVLSLTLVGDGRTA